MFAVNTLRVSKSDTLVLILVNLSAVVMVNALEARLGARIKCQ